MRALFSPLCAGNVVGTGKLPMAELRNMAKAAGLLMAQILLMAM